jgi:hypothetical protein
VHILQRASESHFFNPDKLSKHNIRLFWAWITRSRSLRGAGLSIAPDGSISERNTFELVVLALPCSPWKLRIGQDISVFKAASSQATINRKSASFSKFRYFLSF